VRASAEYSSVAEGHGDEVGAFAAAVGPQGGRDGERAADVGAVASGKRRVPPMPDGWYPHEPGDPFYELDWSSCMSIPPFWSAIGSWRGARGVCECPGCYPAGCAERASAGAEAPASLDECSSAQDREPT
jgi:hypothetical protein